MICEQALEWISGYLDQTNTEEETAQLMQHLSQCPDCRKVLAAFEEIDAGLGELEEEPPEELREDIMQAIRLEKRKSSIKSRRGWLGLAVAAAIVFAVGIGYVPAPSVEEEQPAAMMLRSGSVETARMADQAAGNTVQDLAENMGAEIVVASEQLPELDGCDCRMLEDGRILYTLPSPDMAAQLSAAHGLELYGPVHGAVSDVSYALLLP